MAGQSGGACGACRSPLPRGAKKCPRCGAAVASTRTLPAKTAAVPGRDGLLPIGAVLGEKYKVLEVLGGGGFGEVYRVHHRVLQRELALKTLHPTLGRDAPSRERFFREARILMDLVHPNIVSMRDTGEWKGILYLVMDLCPGRTLAAELKERRRLPAREAVRIALQVLRALEHAHAKGVVHRDLKPSNLVVSRGEKDALDVKVLDFGVAKALPGSSGGAGAAAGAEAGSGSGRGDEPNLTAEGSMVGTIAYMSPEQAQGLAVDVRADLYSLGVVLYEMVTGQLPFRGDNPTQTLMKVLLELPDSFAKKGAPARDLPGLEEVVLRALAKDVRGRPASARDLRHELEALVGVERGARRPPSGVTKKPTQGSSPGSPAPSSAPSSAPDANATPAKARPRASAKKDERPAAVEEGEDQGLPPGLEAMAEAMPATDEEVPDDATTRPKRARGLSPMATALVWGVGSVLGFLLLASWWTRGRGHGGLSSAAYAEVLRAGEQALERGDLDTALTRFEMALRAKPGDPNAVESVQRAKDAKAIEAKYKKAMAAGDEAMAKGDFEFADRRFREALVAKPGDSKARAAVARCETTRSGTADYRRSMEAGEAAFGKGDFVEAERLFGEAVGARPGDAKAGDALARARTARTREGDYRTAMQAGEAAVAKGDLEGASRRYAEALAAKPGDAKARQAAQAIQAARAKVGGGGNTGSGGAASTATAGLSAPGLTFLGRNPQGFEEYEHGQTGVVLVLVPAGGFVMGTRELEGNTDEGPEHRVRITRPFLLGKTEVTNGQFRRFRPTHHSGEYKEHILDGNEQPAVMVSWEDAEAYCRWSGLALPREAEWEYAARGRDQRECLWGEGWPPPAGAGNFADAFAKGDFPEWGTIDGYDDGYAVTAPVGRFQPNPLGLMDLAGNVWEWCADWYRAGYDDGDAADPTGPVSGEARVMRGGSCWSGDRRFLYATSRSKGGPGVRAEFVGFRVAWRPGAGR
ncbi:MAG: SUMF1/EgtB/PvdO family nonheme iron enzyme [Planctomycetes bacterium]|nr:SUMF1/EgtB/PvdO family nonheme iron enzyme [Planctomycetota bacterium]